MPFSVWPPATTCFPKPSLLRASSICTACIGLVKSLTLKTALEMSIPFVAFGWSPGQAPLQSSIMKNNPVFVRENQKTFKKALPPEIAEPLKGCFIPESYYERYKDCFPYNIHPLAFFDYDEEEIKLEIEGLGWEKPTNTDTNSTNCLLNALANEGHLKRHRFHPYVLEIANMVRQGVMTREEGLEKIYCHKIRARWRMPGRNWACRKKRKGEKARGRAWSRGQREKGE